MAWNWNSRSGRAHRHNQKRGWVRMMQKQLQAIVQADTITPEAQDIAARMFADATRLSTALNTRVDPDAPNP